MASSASLRRRAPLGPRLFGGGALLVGALAFVVACFDLSEGRDAEFAPANAAFAPLIITGAWVALAAVYFARQLINPLADYPELAREPKLADDDAEETAPGAIAAAGAAATTAECRERSDAAVVDAASAESLADHAEANPADVRWRAPVAQAIALIGYVLVLEPVGFVLATPVFFVATTVIFGSRRYVRDAIVAVVLSQGVYWLFTGVLGLTLAEGLFAP